MNTTCPDALLSSLVNNIRQASEKHIKFDNFTSVSGFICFDTDGTKQHCYIISEVLQKASAGEGNSQHLKTLNWKDLETGKPLEWHTGNKPYVMVLAPQKTDEKWGSPEKMNPPQNLCILQGASTNLQNKFNWSNRTFTLQMPQPDQCVVPPQEDLQDISTSTITATKEGSVQDNKRCPKRTIFQGSFKKKGQSKVKWSKIGSGPKSQSNSRKCYPRLPKKPVIRERFSAPDKFTENNMASNSRSNNSEALKDKEGGRLYMLKKKICDSSCEKPTALGSFEMILSPGSSVESIDSIEPHFLVPQSDLFTHEDDGGIDGEEEKTQLVELPISTSVKIGKMRNPAPKCVNDHMQMGRGQTKEESPPRILHPHNSASNGTLNTISSIEQDMSLRYLNRESPERKSWIKSDRNSSLSVLPRAVDLENQTLSECSAGPKKRSSLLKWMGLFKKSSKTSCDDFSVPNSTLNHGRQTKVKQKNCSEATSVIGPPPIRLKQWF